MLGSLLPGVREVRTPLTVGYLWLLIAWLAFADRFPTERPDTDTDAVGLTVRLFALGDIVGPAIALAALSFIAYIAGALLTFDPQEGILGRPLQGVVIMLTEPLRRLRPAWIVAGQMAHAHDESPDEASSRWADLYRWAEQVASSRVRARVERHYRGRI